MNTVYQIASNVKAAKDLVFGIVISIDDLEFTPLCCFSVGELKKLEMFTTPAMDATGFGNIYRKAIQDEVHNRGSLNKALESVLAMRTSAKNEKTTPPPVEETKPDRTSDRAKLYKTILLATVFQDNATLTADLGYVVIRRIGEDWSFIDRDYKLTHSFDSLDEMIDRILSRWW